MEEEEKEEVKMIDDGCGDYGMMVMIAVRMMTK